MKIGFIQGRLSPLVDGKIQAFPKDHWRKEFEIAERIGLHLMEWTLDHEGLMENPFVTSAGQSEILSLMQKHSLSIPSVTGDCFMQAPFYKAKNDSLRNELLNELDQIILGCSKLGTRFIVFPLVDQGSLETEDQKTILRKALLERSSFLKEKKVMIVFESDYAPRELCEWIESFPTETFGINYDVGNSASLGFQVREEFDAYAHRVHNLHIKDRLLGGTTVPLGKGNADFEEVFRVLKEHRYSGNFILQTARDPEGHHEQVLSQYVDFVKRGFENE